MAYNRTILHGNLTRDVEVRYLQSGSAVANTGIAVSNKYKNKAGEQVEDTMFIDLAFFGRTAEIANQYLAKGSNVLIEGRLRFEQWTAKDGTNRSRHVVTVDNLQMLSYKEEKQQPAPQPLEQTEPQPLEQTEFDLNEESIPF